MMNAASGDVTTIASSLRSNARRAWPPSSRNAVTSESWRRFFLCSSDDMSSRSAAFKGRLTKASYSDSELSEDALEIQIRYRFRKKVGRAFPLEVEIFHPVLLLGSGKGSHFPCSCSCNDGLHDRPYSTLHRGKERVFERSVSHTILARFRIDMRSSEHLLRYAVLDSKVRRPLVEVPQLAIAISEVA